jgi:ribosome-associated protein
MTDPVHSPSSLSAQTSESYDLARRIAQAADDRKGGNIVLLNVEDVSYLADYFVVVTGYSSVQVRAISRTIEDTIEDDLNRLPLRVEGRGDGNWVLMDYGDVVVHIFMPEEREFYDLEAFWGHAQRIAYVAPARDPHSSPPRV